MKITVTIRNLSQQVYLTLNDEKNEAILGGKPIQLEVAPFASRLLTIVSSWEERMVNDFIIDGEEYSVKIEKDGKNYLYEGRNKFPKNYRDFINLLRSANIC